MARQDFFTVRVNQDERRMLETLAEKLQRTQGDAVRLLIREATRELVAADQQQAAKGVQNGTSG